MINLFLSVFFIIFTFYAVKDALAAPLTVHPNNPRYFTDGSGKAIYLTGSHTWGNFVDVGQNRDSLNIFNYNEYLDFLQSYHHNFMRLWRWELTTWKGNNNRGVVYSAPHPWARTGSTNAADGLPKFNLSQFNQAYFDRLLSRVRGARDHGIFVSVMLFEGNILYQSANDSWRGHPLNSNNNINGINGDFNSSLPYGTEVHTLGNANIVTIQKNYVTKVLETLKNEDNVLYEIGNEMGSYSQAFQNEIINFIKTYETSHDIPQHPVGRTACWYPTSVYRETNTRLFESPSDWYSPGGGADGSEDAAWRDNPPINDGTKKVIIVDSDHLGWSTVTSNWVWKSFLRGHNVIFMDAYKGLQGTGSWVYDYPISQANTIAIRNNMKYTIDYAKKMDLAKMTPSSNSSYCSTTYCLRNPSNEYLIYQPTSGTSFTANLLAGTYSYEWFNPSTGTVSDTGSITAAAGSRSFTPPFSGNAVLYLKKTSDTTPPAAPRGIMVN